MEQIWPVYLSILIMPVKSHLAIYNQRMLQLITEAVKAGIVDYEMEYCKKIEYDHTNLPKIKAGLQSFKIQHIIAAAKLMDVSIDWICGLSKFRKQRIKDYSPTDLIKEGLRMLESNNGVKK